MQTIQWISMWVNGHPFTEIQEAEESPSLLHELFVANHLRPLVYSILIIHTTCSEWKRMEHVRSDPESSAVSQKVGSAHSHEFFQITGRILNTSVLLFETKHTFNVGAILITWVYFLWHCFFCSQRLRFTEIISKLSKCPYIYAPSDKTGWCS